MSNVEGGALSWVCCLGYVVSRALSRVRCLVQGGVGGSFGRRIHNQETIRSQRVGLGGRLRSREHRCLTGGLGESPPFLAIVIAGAGDSGQVGMKNPLESRQS